MDTINSADALGLEDKIGTLTPDKQADIVVVTSKRAFVPSSNPMGTAVLYSSAADVETVMVAGQLRKRNFQLVGHDLAALRQRTTEAVERIHANMANMPPEMTTTELNEFLLATERAINVNLAAAYAGDGSAGALNYLN